MLSHELNNSLGPIASLAHSGAQAARRGDYAPLDGVFGTISERAEHLHQFISRYATFAKLPAPDPKTVDWAASRQICGRCNFCRAADAARVARLVRSVADHQALINLFKNAHEAGGAATRVECRSADG